MQPEACIYRGVGIIHGKMCLFLCVRECVRAVQKSESVEDFEGTLYMESPRL